jgi:hypothetical protein
MRRFLRTTAIVLMTAAMAAVLWSPGARSAVRSDHPRIWLTPEFKATLQARLARNGTDARNLRSWCDGHMTDDLSGYTGSRATETLKAINHALMYQLTGSAAYADRAVAIVEYAFAHPYTGYTINTWPEFDNFYTDRYLVPTVAIVLDWCWDAMTPTQRTTFANQLDWWANDIMTKNVWAWHDPSNNYFYGHMWAILSAGYAIYGLNANAQTYIDYARGTMLDQAIKFTKDQTIMWDLWGSTTGRAKGGMWNEGTSYGCVNYEFLGSCVLAAKSAEGLTYSDFVFPNEAIKYFIYSKHPTGARMYSDGDGAAGGIDATVRIPVLFNIALATGDNRGYGQYWVNTYTSYCDWSYKLYNEFLWYDDQLAPIDYRGVLPDAYYLEGTQVLFWRSDWSTSGIWLALKLGTLNTDHAHNGLGNLMIYKDGFLATDKAVETGDGMAFSDLDHNDLYIPPGDDKKLYWGESTLKHFESTANYLYLAGDLSGPFLAQPSYRNNTVTRKEREIVVIKPENVVAVMDRGTSTDTAHDKVFQMYLHNQATASGGDYRSSNGTSDLVIHPAFPVAPTVTLDTYGAPRLRITTAASSLSKSFLNLLKVTSAGGAFTAAQATATVSDVAAAAFYGSAASVDYVVAFSADPSGAPSTSSSYGISFERSHGSARAYLANLQPNTTYYLKGSTNGTTATVSVSKTTSTGATACMSDADGFLFCEVNLGEAEQGPDPPEPNGAEQPLNP